MLIKHALIMNIGETENGYITITKEAVLNSIKTFEYKPIVYNKNQAFRDYRESNFDNYKNELIIGHILGNVEVTDKEVFADIIVKDEYKDLWKDKYDNWCIQDNKSGFELLSIEVF